MGALSAAQQSEARHGGETRVSRTPCAAQPTRVLPSGHKRCPPLVRAAPAAHTPRPPHELSVPACRRGAAVPSAASRRAALVLLRRLVVAAQPCHLPSRRTSRAFAPTTTAGSRLACDDTRAAERDQGLPGARRRDGRPPRPHPSPAAPARLRRSPPPLLTRRASATDVTCAR